MIKRTVVATIGALAIATGAAYADTGAGVATGHNQAIQNLQNQINQLQGQLAHGGKADGSIAGGLVSTNAGLTNTMLNQQNGVGNDLRLLQARKEGKIAHGLTIGGAVQADAIYQRSDEAGQFLLNGATGNKSASRIDVTSLKLQMVAAINNWTTAYVEAFAPFIGNSTARGSIDSLSFPQAYLLFGDLNQNPVYGFIGRKDIDFGSFAAVTNYVQPLNRILFQANGNTAGVGYSAYGLNTVISAMNGGSQAEAVNVGNFVQRQNLSTTSNANIQNFALNADYAVKTGDVNWVWGGGLLRGSQFNKANNKTNSAWDLNVKANYENFDLLGEFTRTFSDTSANSHVTAWQVAGDYKFQAMGHNATFGLGYSAVNGDTKVSQLNFSSVGATANAQQLTAGVHTEVLKNVNAGVEYAYNRSASNGNTSNFNTVVLDVTAMF